MYIIGITEADIVVFLTEFNSATKAYASTRFISSALEFKSLDDAKKILSQLHPVSGQVYTGFGRQVFPAIADKPRPPSPDPWFPVRLATAEAPTSPAAPLPPAPPPTPAYQVVNETGVVGYSDDREQAFRIARHYHGRVLRSLTGIEQR
jgi:hypothetical protein